jgi:hypothetical protein
MKQGFGFNTMPAPHRPGIIHGLMAVRGEISGSNSDAINPRLRLKTMP